jgi:hypothetical protein
MTLLRNIMLLCRTPRVFQRMKAELKQLLDDGRSRPLAGESLVSKDDFPIIRNHYFYV